MWKRLSAGLVIVGLSGLGLAWMLGWIGPDPALAEVQAIQAQLSDPEMNEADRRALMEQFRSKMDTLSPESRRVVWESNREMFANRMEARMDRILTMPPAEQIKAIDEEIDRMERMRVEREKRRAANANRVANGGSNGPGPSGNASGNRGRGGPRAGRGPATDEQRVARLRNRLDRSSPQSRAKRNEFVGLINKRRQQRGLPIIERPTRG